MSPRQYRQGRRADSAGDTRQRIVEATFALHDEQGIAATSMKQIAARADVSVGTVYHHFPTYEDAVMACGQYTMANHPPPDGGVLAGAGSVADRVGRVVAAAFGYFAGLPVLEKVRCDQHLMPVLRSFVAGEEANRRRLFARALDPAAEPRHVDLAVALTDPAVHGALRRAGWDTADAAREIARRILAAPPPGSRPAGFPAADPTPAGPAPTKR